MINTRPTRVVYDDEKIIIIQGQGIGNVEDRPIIKGEIKHFDIPYFDNGVSNIQIEKGIITYDINEPPKNYKQLYETEILSDLMTGGVINGAISSDNK